MRHMFIFIVHIVSFYSQFRSLFLVFADNLILLEHNFKSWSICGKRTKVMLLKYLLDVLNTLQVKTLNRCNPFHLNTGLFIETTSNCSHAFFSCIYINSEVNDCRRDHVEDMASLTSRHLFLDHSYEFLIEFKLLKTDYHRLKSIW